MQKMSTPAKARRSSIIKPDGLRLGSEEKVAVEPYRFGQRSEVSAPVLEGLKLRHDEFVPRLESRLSLFLRAEVTAEVEEFTVVQYQQFLAAMELKPHLNLFQATGLSGAGFIGFEPKVALSAINLLLGGSGETAPKERALTRIESDLSADLAQECLGAWAELWTEYAKFEPKIYGQESDLKNLSLFDAHTAVCVLKMKLKVREQSGSVLLVYPLHMVQTAVLQMEQSAVAEAPAASARGGKWSSNYNQVTVRAQVQVPIGRLTIRDFAELEPGAILPMASDALDHACLQLSGRSLFVGRFGVDGEQLALSIERKI